MEHFKKKKKNFLLFKILSVVMVVTIMLAGCTGTPGADGKDGKDGKDGITPTISINEDGYWVINGEVTEFKATGNDGKNGVNGKDGQTGETPTITINKEGYWVINGKATEFKAAGNDGTPGTDGKDGKTPTIEINEEGYWVINGEITEFKVEGNLKESSLSKLILEDNEVIKSNANLTTTSNHSSDPSGLYKFSSTNSGEPVYFFRGNVTNNYVKFANYLWRILRINEDMSVRIIMQESINNFSTYDFATNSGKIESTYYSNSKIKSIVDSWYESNLKLYDSFIANGLYCEESRVVGDPLLVDIGEAIHKVYNEYEPTLKCNKDGNGYGVLNLKIGLITYDEELLAGSYYQIQNSEYFLANGKQVMTMSPSGCYENSCYVWNRGDSNKLGFSTVNQLRTIRPVINLKSTIEFKGKGTSSEPYEIK